MDNRPYTILLVDDDPDDIELTRQMLRGVRFPVEFSAASNGREALAVLRGEAPHPDLILLDLNMPVMDGREFLSVLKEDPKLRAIPTVIFSTASVAEQIARCCGLGANGYVKKPMRLAEFDEVKAVIEDFRTISRGAGPRSAPLTSDGVV